MRTILFTTMFLCACALCWASNWVAAGNDPQRTGWQRNEKTLTKANVKDMKLLWKIKLDSKPREMHNLFPPLLLDNVSTADGPKQIAVVAGVSDDLYGIDVATGKLLWSKHYTSDYKPEAGGRGPGTLCPGGQTAEPVAAPGSTPGSYVIYAVGWDGRLREINAADGKNLAPPAKFTLPNGKPYALNLFNGAIYTSTSQGCGNHENAFLSYDLATKKASAFLPGGGGLWGRRGVAIAPDGTVYMGTGDGPYDPANKHLGNAIVAVKMDANKQLQLAGYYAPPNAVWLWHRDQDINVTPVAFDYQGRHFLIGSSKECRVWLLDRDHFGGDDHITSLYTTPLICNDVTAFDAKGVWGDMAVWQDSAGTQWIVVPFWGPVSTDFHAPVEYGRPKDGGVAAFKLEQQSGKWKLVPAWLSANMDMADGAVVANGIVFAYGSGEDTTQQRPDIPWNEPQPKVPTMQGVRSARRIVGSTHATLYALDGETGKVLWSSGDQITSWNHWSGIAVANGRVYIPTFDGYLYCFGIEQP